MARPRSGWLWICVVLATVGAFYLIRLYTVTDQVTDVSVSVSQDSQASQASQQSQPSQPSQPNRLNLVPLLKTEREQIDTAKTLRWLVEKRPVEFQCGKKARIANYRSTDSWTYCADPAYLPTKPCLVYSFGVNWDFSFEDAMEKLGCDVMSYDPSMDTVAHRHSPLVYFQPVGLGHEDSNVFVPKRNNQVKKWTQWKIRTLKTLVEENKHTERTIDILKFDVETYEWNVTANLIDSGVLRQVKQLLLEWHIFPHTPKREQFLQLATVLQDLDKPASNISTSSPTV